MVSCSQTGRSAGKTSPRGEGESPQRGFKSDTSKPLPTSITAAITINSTCFGERCREQDVNLSNNHQPAQSATTGCPGFRL